MCRQVYPQVERRRARAPRRQLVGSRRRRRGGRARVARLRTAHGLTPARPDRDDAVAGTEPVIMLTAPGPATDKVLEQAGMTVADIDLFEINEAFAAVPLKTIRDLDLDPGRVQRQRRRDRPRSPDRRDRRDADPDGARRARAHATRAPRSSPCAPAAGWAPPRSSSGSEQVAPGLVAFGRAHHDR